VSELWYRLVSDNDGHHYVIPSDLADEWEAWAAIDSDDERAWTPPQFAVEVDNIEFAEWRRR